MDESRRTQISPLWLVMNRVLVFPLLDGENDAREAWNYAEDNANHSDLCFGPIRAVVMEHTKGNTVEEMSALPRGV